MLSIQIIIWSERAEAYFSLDLFAYFLGQCQKVGGVWGKAPQKITFNQKYPYLSPIVLWRAEEGRHLFHRRAQPHHVQRQGAAGLPPQRHGAGVVRLRGEVL